MRDWDNHRLILTLHRHGTLRATGEALGVTHTTIARRLAALEAQEPAPVFTRHNRACQATAYGLERVALAERMEALDQSATRIQRRSGDGLSGPISLSVPQAVVDCLLLEDIHAFSQVHPQIELTLFGSDRIVDLDRGEADVVIRGDVSPPDHLVGRQICTVALHYYAHKRYLDNTPVSERKWVALRAENDWILDSPYPDRPVGLIIHDIPSHFKALTRGLGLGRTACFMADAHPDLIRLDSSPATPRYGLWVLTHPDLRQSPKIKALMAAMSDALKRQKDRIEGRSVG